MPPAAINPGTHSIDLGNGFRLWVDDTGHFWMTFRTPGGQDIHTMLTSDVVPITSDEIDFTTTGVYTIIPPTPRRLLSLQSQGLWLTLVGGTRSAGPTLQAGTNSAIDNIAASQTGAAGFLSQAVDTRLGVPFSAVSPLPVPDLSQFGLRVSVTVGVSGAGAVCKGKFVGFAQLGT